MPSAFVSFIVKRSLILLVGTERRGGVNSEVSVLLKKDSQHLVGGEGRK